MVSREVFQTYSGARASNPRRKTFYRVQSGMEAVLFNSACLDSIQMRPVVLM